MNQHSIRVLPIVLLASMFLSGCGQSEIDGIASGDDASHYGEPVTLSISLQNNTEYQTPELGTPAPHSREPLIAEWVRVNSFDATRSAEDPNSANLAAMELFEDSVSSAPQTRAVMPAGYCFRIIAFKKSGSAYVFQSVADYTSSGASAPVLVQGSMDLRANLTYRFVGYSFNNNIPMGALPGSYSWNSTAVSIPNLNNDFLTFDSGDKLVTGDSYSLSVSFTQQLCKLTIRITVAGFDNNTFTNCTGVYIKQGGNSSSWNVGANTINANTNNTATFNIPNNNTTTSVRLVPFAAERPITVHFGTLTIGGKAANNTDITSSQNVKLLPCKSYTMTVQFKKGGAGITVPEGDINLGTYCTEQDKKDLAKLIWADGNLKSTDNSRPYVWTTPHDYGYYYTWNSTYTGNATHNGIDPCSKLDTKYGTGWRTPSHNEHSKLAHCNDAQLVSNNGVKGMWFMNNTKGLFLPAAGYRHYLDGSGTVGLESVGRVGNYWSSDVTDDYNAYALLFTSSGGASGGGPNAYGHGYTVRCVKGTKQ